MKLRHFPFDVQECVLEITTLTDSALVNIVNIDQSTGGNSQSLDGAREITNIHRVSQTSLNVWTLLGNHLNETVGPNGSDTIYYLLLLKRKASLYVSDIVVPCALLSFASGATLFIISNLETRLTVNLSILVALSVYQMSAGGSVPQTDEMPLLSKFLLIQLLLTYCVMGFTIFLVYFQPSEKGMSFGPPKRLYNFFVKRLGRLFLVKAYKVDQVKDVDKEVNSSEDQKIGKSIHGNIYKHQWSEMILVFDKIAGIGFMITYLVVLLWFIIVPSDDAQISDILESLHSQGINIYCNGSCINA